ncbi:capreomycidine synthase [Actinomadura sp. 9N215]|uniref:capreomycidine synthase n=1 Tax=Actinomadura sp. 9N215 TaxID=3375150 RepID=UPI00378E54E9
MSAPAANLRGIEPALLEDWLRDRYFTAKIDISCSGVREYSLGELLRLTDLDHPALEGVEFRDAPSLGGERPRAAVANRYAPGRADRVMMTNGSSEGIFLALAALIRPGDEVIVPRPAYQSLTSIAAALGARLRVWELPAGDGFAADLDRLTALMSPATRIVVANFPHNPTGTTLGRDEYERLVELVARHGCHLFWDGAFAELAHDAPALPDPVNDLERCVSFGTLSKAFGFPGLRAGWCFAPPELLTEMVRIRDYLTLALSPLNEALAAAVIEHADAVIGPRLAEARQGREILLAWARDNGDVVSLPPPRGGVTAFPKIIGLDDVTALCADLATHAGVLVVPGACFTHPDRMRIGYAVQDDHLRSGLAAVTTAIHDAVAARR